MLIFTDKQKRFIIARYIFCVEINIPVFDILMLSAGFTVLVCCLSQNWEVSLVLKSINIKLMDILE